MSTQNKQTASTSDASANRGNGIDVHDASLLEAFSLQPDGPAKAREFTTAAYKATHLSQNEALTSSRRTKAGAVVRLRQLATELPGLREAIGSGLPYPPLDSDEPKLPNSWVSRAAVAATFVGLCLLEGSTCATVYSYALPAVQMPIAAASMAAPLAATPFTVKLFAGAPSPVRYTLGVASLFAIGNYSWFFAKLVGGDMASMLGTQFIAETLAMAAISLGISRLLQPGATDRAREALVMLEKEEVDLTGDLEVADAHLNTEASGEIAAVLKAEALVIALQEAESGQKAYVSNLSKRIRDLAGGFFNRSRSN